MAGCPLRRARKARAASARRNPAKRPASKAKRNPSTRYYAAHDADLVWGVGTSPSAALRDAVQWYTESGKSKADVNDLDTTRITQAHYRAIKAGDPAWYKGKSPAARKRNPLAVNPRPARKPKRNPASAYQSFVKKHLPGVIARGISAPAAMSRVAAMWRQHKRDATRTNPAKRTARRGRK